MSNLARPRARSTVAVLGPREQQALADELLGDLRVARQGAPSLAGLSPVDYARTHTAFELLSDQRRLIGDHLTDCFARRTTGPVSVLAVGCGDGTLDAPLAAALADVRPARPVRYVGADPHAASTQAFSDSLRDLGRDSLTAEVHTATFEDLDVLGEFDVVTFVHSMYYVDDVAQTLAAAHALLRPGGELIVLSAPMGALNRLVEVLAPPRAGHEQWFSDDVATGLERSGLEAEAVVTLEAGLDVAGASDDVLDFAVQAQLTPELRLPVRAYLDAVTVTSPSTTAGPAPSRRVPHPVDVYWVRRAA